MAPPAPPRGHKLSILFEIVFNKFETVRYTLREIKSRFHDTVDDYMQPFHPFRTHINKAKSFIEYDMRHIYLAMFVSHPKYVKSDSHQVSVGVSDNFIPICLYSTVQCSLILIRANADLF
jgi:hypothetical protein